MAVVSFRKVFSVIDCFVRISVSLVALATLTLLSIDLFYLSIHPICLSAYLSLSNTNSPTNKKSCPNKFSSPSLRPSGFRISHYRNICLSIYILLYLSLSIFVHRILCIRSSWNAQMYKKVVRHAFLL